MPHPIEDIFKAYYRRLCHFALQMTRDPAVVEDLVQDAFAGCWDRIDRVSEDPAELRSFLYASVRNASFNYLKRLKVVSRWESLQQGDTIDDPETLNCIIRAEVLAEVYRIVCEMPAGCQEVFRMGYLEGISNPEIAKTLKLSINTVKTQKQRGMKILRERLNPRLVALFLSLF